ncbi:DNA-binding domain-containing protein [Pseudomonas akapageensis]|uniref:HvfC/BufC N-terminal domain-containing protein n=1 Tax=Pseudomonas akapageensis TaxID=2609961 RepID=UPI00140B9196|nr:DNA-binding domain-containing protein [Pseudomonas akapageensis]
MKLNDWQAAFEAYLLGDDPGVAERFADTFVGGPSLSVGTGMKIYHNAYRARLQEVLSADFPVTRQWLGDEKFAELTGQYLRRCPSRHYSLRWLGEHLASHVGHDTPLAELVRLEWAFTLAFDAQPKEPLALQDMACLQTHEWPSLQVSLLPSVQWLDCRYNSLELWRAAKDQNSLPESKALEREVVWLVWRVGLNCYYRSLDAGEAAALRGMTHDKWTFAELCLQLTNSFADNAPLQAATWLKQWVTDSLLERKFD